MTDATKGILLMVGFFVAGYATSYEIDQADHRQAVQYRQEAKTESERVSFAANRLAKIRSQIYSALDIKEDENEDDERSYSQEEMDEKTDAFADALAKKLIQQRDAK
jgi:hypothetical protein